MSTLERQAGAQQSAKKIYSYAGKTFILDLKKAQEAIAGKKIINGVKTQAFNLLPLKYTWAYDLYKQMKANHWEPEDIPMGGDVKDWEKASDIERWIIRMAIGYFSAAEGIVGDNILHAVREAVTASELKLVLGRHAHEENIHADSLLYMLSSLPIDPYEIEAMMWDIPTIVAKNDFVTRYTYPLRGDVDYNDTENKIKLAKNMFVYGLAMEGTQFYGLFGMVLALYRANKFRGIGQMFRYTMRDESNHITLFTKLLAGLVEENPDIDYKYLSNELRNIMKEAVELEIAFIEDCLPVNALGLVKEDFIEHVKYLSNVRLQQLNIRPLYPEATEKLEWLSEAIDIRKEQNFFEGRVTEYRKASALVDEEDL